MKIFGLTVSLLFFSIISLVPFPASGDEYRGGVSVREMAKTTFTADGQPVRYLVTDKPEVTALVVEISPGGETGWHLHPVPVYAYIIKGALEVEMENGDIHTYNEGDAVIEMVGKPHNGKNRGEIPVKLAAFYTGEQGAPNTVKVLEMKKPGQK